VLLCALVCLSVALHLALGAVPRFIHAVPTSRRSVSVLPAKRPTCLDKTILADDMAMSAQKQRIPTRLSR
jgi:hypothetical protein